MLTFVCRIQRERLSSKFRAFVTLVLFVIGVRWINYWDAVSNLVVGVVAGLIAVLIRDRRMWAARFRGQVYRRTHRYF
jgi:hypothetical protein